MAGVAAGGDRQELHEVIRVHSQAAALRVKQEGLSNNLLELLSQDPAFAKVNVEDVLAPEQYTGRAEQQVYEFLDEVIAPILDSNTQNDSISSEVRV
jgi:adenylosuccinate lyase